MLKEDLQCLQACCIIYRMFPRGQIPLLLSVSIPEKSTSLKAYGSHINKIWITGSLVVRYERFFDRKDESMELHHYLLILAKKGLAQSVLYNPCRVSGLIERTESYS